MDEAVLGAWGLAIASAVLLALGWAIGVLGKVTLINNYRAHPERYPDAQGLGRWMGFTLAAGGASFGVAAMALGANLVGEDGVGIWSGITAAGLVALSLGGLARYRRMPPADGRGRKGR
jgi:hypothetical protein